MATPLTKKKDEENVLSTANPGVKQAGTGTGGTVDNPSTQPETQQDINRIVNLNKNANTDVLLDSIKTQGNVTRDAISNATDKFNTAAGDDIIFDDESDFLTDVITGKKELDAGYDVVNKEYEGPTAINKNLFNDALGQFGDQSNLTQTQGGINTLLGMFDPSLSTGARRFDSIIYGANENFKNESRDIRNDYYNAAADATTASEDAAQLADTRIAQAEDFREDARGFVDNYRTDIGSTLDARVQAENARDRDVADFLQQLEQGLINIGEYQPKTEAGVQTASATPQPQINPDYFNFDPSTFDGIERVTSMYGTDIYDRTINPLEYLGLVQGQAANRNNVATGEEATQFNRASQLIDSLARITPQERQQAMIKYGADAFDTALAQAQAEAEAADQAETLRLLELAKQEQARMEAMGTTGGTGSESGVNSAGTADLTADNVVNAVQNVATVAGGPLSMTTAAAITAINETFGLNLPGGLTTSFSGDGRNSPGGIDHDAMAENGLGPNVNRGHGNYGVDHAGMAENGLGPNVNRGYGGDGDGGGGSSGGGGGSSGGGGAGPSGKSGKGGNRK